MVHRSSASLVSAPPCVTLWCVCAAAACPDKSPCLMVVASDGLQRPFMLVLSASLPVAMQGSSGELVPVFNIICFA